MEFVETWHSDPDVRRRAGCEVLRQNTYVEMAKANPFWAQHPNNPNKTQNTINKDILNRCNKIYKQYLLLKEECWPIYDKHRR